ncbi:unnamed protein product [Candida verbasci]|uniref:Uncharacterized protein n=1 Tax=Candida verbasci TaxID=1227364 RepID=A0A9W4TYA7_9ASCO|nr:unnamed protein product [Candida verbasci]
MHLQNIILISTFKNLSIQDKILQLTRLSTCCITLVFVLTILLAPLFNNNTYLCRINCAHLDVSLGLYKSLRNSVTSTPSILTDSGGFGPSGNSLTNSEISLLSQYAENQVAGAPQYCITSLWNWCYGNYDIVQSYDKFGNLKYIRQNEVLNCDNTKKFVFNYKMELKAIGLESILAYAYQASTDTNDSKYDSMVNSRNKAFGYAINAIIFTAVSQFVLLVLTLVIYSKKEVTSQVPKFILHITGLIALTSLISIVIGSALITNLLLLTRKEIASTLGDFGVSFHVGTKWFAMLWTCCAFAILSGASWCLPLWCSNPEIVYEEEPSYFDIRNKDTGYHDFKNKFRISSKPEPEVVYDNDHEEEMRKLGESLSKKSTVRRLNTLKKKPEKELLIYDYTSIQEEIYDGYNSSASISRTPSEHKSKTYRRSYLDDDELVLLDNQMFTVDR